MAYQILLIEMEIIYDYDYCKIKDRYKMENPFSIHSTPKSKVLTKSKEYFKCVFL